LYVTLDDGHLYPAVHVEHDDAFAGRYWPAEHVTVLATGQAVPPAQVYPEPYVEHGRHALPFVKVV
jgi:hypothetical protein